MDGEWSDGAAVSSPTVSGGDGKVIGRPHGVPAAEDSPGSSPVSPAAPSTAAPAATGRRRSANKRVVTVPLADVSGPRPKGVGEGNTPTDSWAWRKYGQKPIKGSPFPSHDVAAGVLGTEGGAAAAATAAVEVHDDFRWLYDGVSVTSSTSPSDVDAAADEMLYGATMFFGGAVAGAPLSDEFGDVGGLFDGGEGGGEEDAMFAGLGELPECAMVFRRHAGDGKVGQQPAESAAMS
nr:unnamed protein product [Digitaria exilis]